MVVGAIPLGLVIGGAVFVPNFFSIVFMILWIMGVSWIVGAVIIAIYEDWKKRR